VDPETAVSEAVTLVVSRQARVLVAATGVGGLMIAADRAVVLVIADGRLPDMSPGDFLRILGLLRPDVPVAFLGVDAPSQESLEPRANAYFPEPIHLKGLLRWIADSLDRPIPPRAESGPGVAAPPVRYDVPVRHLEIVQWVVEFIERCYQEGTRFSEVARAAGISRSHLCRIFKRVTGLPLKRFLTRRRLQAAKALLRDPAMAIHEVASTVGYHDPSQFDRVFRQWEGQPPSLYRRQVVGRRGPRGQPLSHAPRRNVSAPFPAEGCDTPLGSTCHVFIRGCIPMMSAVNFSLDRNQKLF
jgi:AraC-like DNA-binding protein